MHKTFRKCEDSVKREKMELLIAGTIGAYLALNKFNEVDNSGALDEILENLLPYEHKHVVDNLKKTINNYDKEGAIIDKDSTLKLTVGALRNEIREINISKLYSAIEELQQIADNNYNRSEIFSAGPISWSLKKILYETQDPMFHLWGGYGLGNERPVGKFDGEVNYCKIAKKIDEKFVSNYYSQK
jgi:hypothetical protein